MSFTLLQKRFKSLEKEILINEKALEGIADRIFYGEPGRETTIWERAAILLRDLIMEHLFSDGNKRVAFLVTTAFLSKNGYEWKTNENALISFTLNVSAGNITEIPAIAQWIENHMRQVRDKNE